jgi:hypothetical protein
MLRLARVFVEPYQRLNQPPVIGRIADDESPIGPGGVQPDAAGIIGLLERPLTVLRRQPQCAGQDEQVG